MEFYYIQVKTTCNKEDEQVDNDQEEKEFSQADPRSSTTEKMYLKYLSIIYHFSYNAYPYMLIIVSN